MGCLQGQGLPTGTRGAHRDRGCLQGQGVPTGTRGAHRDKGYIKSITKDAYSGLGCLQRKGLPIVSNKVPVVMRGVYGDIGCLLGQGVSKMTWGANSDKGCMLTVTVGCQGCEQ